MESAPLRFGRIWLKVVTEHLLHKFRSSELARQIASKKMKKNSRLHRMTIHIICTVAKTERQI